MILAPIKRPLSTKNTSPSQKSVFILPGHHPVTGSAPFLCLRPWFHKLSVRILNWSATRHPSGSRSMKEKFKWRLRSNHPFFFMTPGPKIGPQKNIGTLLCPMGSYKTQGLKNASHRGLTTRADHEKRHPPGFFLRECNGVPTKLWGFEPPISWDHRCSPN